MESNSDARVTVMLAQASRMRRLAASLLRAGGDLEPDDVVQEVQVAAMTHAIRDESALLPWLRRITRSFALESLRRRSRRERRERAVARHEAQSPADELSRRLELHHAVLDALGELPDPYRSVVSRRFLDGIKPARIAQETGEPVATVKTRLRRALERLRDRLRREWGGELAIALTTLAGRGVPTATTATAATTAMGVMVMSSKAKVLVAAAAVTLAALVAADRLELFGTARGDGGDDAARSAAATAGPGAAEGVDLASAPEATRSDASASDARPRRDRVELRRLSSLRGRVVDEHDRAVAGARVEIVRRLGGELPEPPLATSPELPRERHEAVAAADGRFEFPELMRGAVFNVFASSDRAERGAAYRQRAGQADDVVVRIAPSTTIVGFVLDAVGRRPVGGATVVVLRTDASEGGPLDRVTTAADGSFTIEGVQPAFATTDRVGIVAMTADSRFSATRSIRLVPNDRVETTLTVGSEHWIDGLVVDATSGDPIAGAVVQFGSYGVYRGFVAARSAADGRFQLSLDAVTEAHFRIDATVGARGYAPEQVVLADAGPRSEPLHVALGKARVVRGRLVSRSGEPVAGVLVSACPAEMQFNVGSVVAVTDRDGAFRLEQVAAASLCYLLVRDDEHERLRHPFAAGDAAEVDLGEVRIGVGALLAGTLVDELGRPLPHGSVIVSNRTIDELRQSTPADADREALAQKTTAEYIDRRSVECDERGRFECHGLTAGRWAIRAGSNGYCGAPVDVAVELADEEIRDDLTIVVPQQGVIVGRVLDEQRRPVVHASLTLFAPPTQPGAPLERRRDEQSDDDGRFRFAGLTDGPFEISVSPRRFRRDDPPLCPTRVKQLVPGPTELQVVVRFGALLTGVVEDSEHSPLAYAAVQAMDEGGFVEIGHAQADMDGQFELVLPPDFDVQVIARRSRPYVSQSVLPRLDGSEPDGSNVVRARPGDPPLRLTIRP